MWDSLVDTAHMPDAYYRPGYARAYQDIGQGRAVAFVVEIPGARALFPLLIKPLETLHFTHREQGLDASTPYGYGGMVLLDGLLRVDQEQGLALLNEVRECCKEAGVISAYVRLQPVTHQPSWFTNAPEQGVTLLTHGPTTAIDLSDWSSEAGTRATMQKNRRTDLNLARRHLHITWTSEGRDHEVDLKIFFELYEYRMTQLGAAAFYHFPFSYYRSLAQGLGTRLEIAIAWYGEQPVGVGMFLIDGAVAHYHLSATNDIGRKLAANTLIIDAAARYAWLRRCQHLHLGGGLHEQDRLFAFKKSFGGSLYQYSSVGLVCNPPSYQTLVLARQCSSRLQPPRSGFFPSYRA
jgi:hypothetical protein